MNKVSFNSIYLVASFILISYLLFYGSSQLLAYYKSGSEATDLIVIDSESIGDYYQPKVICAPLANQGRPMEKASLEKVLKDYTASYYHQYAAFTSGNDIGLHDHYTELAREKIFKQMNWLLSQNQRVIGTSIEHHVSIDFYSEDGTIITLTDQVISYEEINEDDFNVYAHYDTSSFRVMLLLEDNYWRVRHKVRFDSTIVEVDRNFPLDGSSILNFKIKGINYYPKENPWQKMWEEFHPQTIDLDFQKIHDAGFNTIRIFIPYHDFGGATVNEEELNKLNIVLELASSNNLKVIVTLFDFFLGYPIDEWSLSDRHLETVVNAIKDHPSLLAWDIKNEPDLDFESMGKEKVLSWLDFSLKRLSYYDPDTPITIGWSTPDKSDNLMDRVDFISFHFYAEIHELESFLSSTEFSKPIFLGETGSHSFNSWWYPFKRSNKDQLAYCQSIVEIIEKYQLHYAFWTLYDFQKIPSNVAGKWPCKRGHKRHMAC